MTFVVVANVPGVALMVWSALAASVSLVSREIMFEPSRAILVMTCWLTRAFEVSTTPSVSSRSTGRQIANSTMLCPRFDGIGGVTATKCGYSSERLVLHRGHHLQVDLAVREERTDQRRHEGPLVVDGDATNV